MCVYARALFLIFIVNALCILLLQSQTAADTQADTPVPTATPTCTPLSQRVDLQERLAIFNDVCAGKMWSSVGAELLYSLDFLVKVPGSIE
jgi:hypothetical protein